MIGVKIILELFFSLILHELAHLLMYIIFKFKIYSFYIIPIKICRKNGKVRCEIKISFQYLGQVIPVIPKLDSDQYIRTVKIVKRSLIFGPLINLFIFFICLILMNHGDVFIQLAYINIIFFLSTFQRSSKTLGDINAVININRNSDYIVRILLGFVLEDKNHIKENEIYLKNCNCSGP